MLSVMVQSFCDGEYHEATRSFSTVRDPEMAGLTSARPRLVLRDDLEPVIGRQDQRRERFVHGLRYRRRDSFDLSRWRSIWVKSIPVFLTYSGLLINLELKAFCSVRQAHGDQLPLDGMGVDFVE